MGFEGVRRGLDLGEVVLPGSFGADLVMVGSGCAVDEFSMDVGVAGVLGGLRPSGPPTLGRPVRAR